MPLNQTSNGTVQSDQEREFPDDYQRPEPSGVIDDDSDIDVAGRAISALGDEEDGSERNEHEDPGQELDDRDLEADADDTEDEEEAPAPRRKEAPRTAETKDEAPKNESNADRLLRKYATGTEHDAPQDRGRVSADQPKPNKQRQTEGEGGEEDGAEQRARAGVGLFSEDHLQAIENEWDPRIAAPMREANKVFAKVQEHNSLLTRTLMMLINDRRLDARMSGLEYLKQYQDDISVAESYGLKGSALSKANLGSLDEIVTEAMKLRETAAENNDFVSFGDAMEAAMKKRHEAAVKRRQAQVAKQKRDASGQFVPSRPGRIAIRNSNAPVRSVPRPSREQQELDAATRSLMDFEQSRARPNGPRRR